MTSKRNSLIGKFVYFDAKKIEGLHQRQYLRGHTRMFGNGTTRRLWHVSYELHYKIDGEEVYDKDGKLIPNKVIENFKPDGWLLLGSELGQIVNAHFSAAVEELEAELTRQGKEGEVVAIPVKITVRG